MGTDDTIDSAHNIAYKVFCEEIDAKICKKKEILIKNLVDISRKYITKYKGNQDGLGYRASKLKKRLMKIHPQLVFHAPSRRNTTELVFAEDLSTGTLAQQLFFW